MEIPSLSQAICRWDIKINLIIDQGFRVGITSNHTLIEQCFVDDKTSSNYGYMASGGLKVSKGQKSKYAKQAYRTGEIVGIKLNLKERFVEFFINNKSFGKAFTDIDVGENINYRLAISMYGINHGVTIQNFEYLTM